MDTNNINQDELLKANMSGIKNIFIIMSGKGGVGKTTVSVNLAYALSLKNKKVGIIDVDMHGPNIAKMLGIENKVLDGKTETVIEPVKVTENLRAVSLALMGLNPDDPIIWRGPIKYSIIRQFLRDVNWGELDYLIIDCPPGTGDEVITLAQLIKNITGAIIVTTPQDVAILDSRKSITFSNTMGIPVTGIIENMSGFVCPHCDHTIDIFKKGGGEKASKDFNIPFLGKIPLELEFVELGDAGTPFVIFDKESKAKTAFMEIVGKII